MFLAGHPCGELIYNPNVVCSNLVWRVIWRLQRLQGKNITWTLFKETNQIPTCLRKSCTMLSSETCDPIANLFLSCFSTLRSIWCSSSDVNPSAPARSPEWAASRVDTWNRRMASSTWRSVAKGWSSILARASEMRMMASSCLEGGRKEMGIEYGKNRYKKF